MQPTFLPSLAAVSEEPESIGIKKRKRVTKSCTPCYEGRKACDRQTPCGTCLKRRIIERCVYRSQEGTSIQVDPEVRRIRELEAERARLRILAASRPDMTLIGHLPPQTTAPPPQSFQNVPQRLSSLLPPTSANVIIHGAVFGVLDPALPDTLITSELYVHGAQAPGLINYINKESGKDELIVYPQWVFETSPYSESQEFYFRNARQVVRYQAMYQGVTLTTLLLAARPAQTELESIWGIFAEYFIGFYGTSKTDLLRHSFEQFAIHQDLNDFSSQASLITAARFAIIMGVSAILATPQQASWSIMNTVLIQEYSLPNYELDKRHTASRWYLAVGLDLLDLINVCTVEVVYVELLACFCLFSIGAMSSLRTEFASLLAKGVSMGMHKDANGLLGAFHSPDERIARNELKHQIQKLDFILSTCTGRQPMSFDIFTGPIECPNTEDMFSRLFFQGVNLGKSIYGEIFDQDRPQSYQKATELTGWILRWREQHPPSLLPAYPQSNSSLLANRSLYRPSTPAEDAAAIDDHKTACLTVKTCMLMMLVNRPYMDSEPSARHHCATNALLMLQTVFDLRRQAPECRLLQRRHTWSWLMQAAIVLTYRAMREPTSQELAQIKDALNTLQIMAHAAKQDSAVWSFAQVIARLHSFVITL